MRFVATTSLEIPTREAPEKFRVVDSRRMIALPIEPHLCMRLDIEATPVGWARDPEETEIHGLHAYGERRDPGAADTPRFVAAAGVRRRKRQFWPPRVAMGCRIRTTLDMRC